MKKTKKVSAAKNKKKSVKKTTSKPKNIPVVIKNNTLMAAPISTIKDFCGITNTDQISRTNAIMFGNDGPDENRSILTYFAENDASALCINKNDRKLRFIDKLKADNSDVSYLKDSKYILVSKDELDKTIKEQQESVQALVKKEIEKVQAETSSTIKDCLSKIENLSKELKDGLTKIIYSQKVLISAFDVGKAGRPLEIATFSYENLSSKTKSLLIQILPLDTKTGTVTPATITVRAVTESNYEDESKFELLRSEDGGNFKILSSISLKLHNESSCLSIPCNLALIDHELAPGKKCQYKITYFVSLSSPNDRPTNLSHPPAFCRLIVVEIPN